jgi:D-3-phosphoglycerate dehydrogenase / 2-oxoglutarate reductase
MTEGRRPAVLVAEPRDFSPRARRILEAVADVRLEAVDDEGLARAFKSYDAVWVRLARRITADMLGPGPRCRILATATTGLDHVDLEACGRLGIRVVSLRGEVEFLKTVRATAEHTLALTLAVLRRIPAAHAAAIGGGWDRDRFRGSELFEKTVGVAGVGRLGSLIAGYFRALGAEVIGYDPRADYPHAAATRTATLHELLARSDVVCLCVSYDASTRRLIGPAEFAALKRTAVLVNTSRGGVVDEQALLEALQSGRLAGAALDVLDGEPAIDENHPIVRYAGLHDNVVLTPHLGGNTSESLDKTETFLAGRVVDALGELRPAAATR